jgi:hypothetical protein
LVDTTIAKAIDCFFRRVIYMILIIASIVLILLILVFSLTSSSVERMRTIMNPNAKVDGVTTHKKHVDFADDVDVMKYDTVTGNSLGMSRGRLNVSKEIIGAVEKDVLGDLLKIAGTVEEVAIL